MVAPLAFAKVVEAARRPQSRKARKSSVARVKRAIGEALSAVEAMADPPLALADLAAIGAGNPSDSEATRWRASVAAMSAQIIAEFEARHVVSDERDMETLLLTAT